MFRERNLTAHYHRLRRDDLTGARGGTCVVLYGTCVPMCQTEHTVQREGRRSMSHRLQHMSIAYRARARIIDTDVQRVHTWAGASPAAFVSACFMSSEAYL